jgi:hypothetical protein
MATSGKDIGDYKFELENLENYLEFYFQMLVKDLPKKTCYSNIFTRF